jgi:hypothetical protein
MRLIGNRVYDTSRLVILFTLSSSDTPFDKYLMFRINLSFTTVTTKEVYDTNTNTFHVDYSAWYVNSNNYMRMVVSYPNGNDIGYRLHTYGFTYLSSATKRADISFESYQQDGTFTRFGYGTGNIKNDDF